ncbi:PAS domain S-box protein [Nostoc sp. TCL26-01]|uniref:PAS domain S-box protein n=1 Tax=Nostoc sp. TCL26-01 TaxID=2576904 RepID=UPI0015BEF0C8|nr:PAS domain S-box protein [Nostoc sp. TCL26-01]QLE55929.1 PAS domain S-box protein [Nostoc sp. TCL26-01]
MKGIRSRFAPYIVALLAVSIAVLVTLLLKPLLTPTIFLLFFAAVAVSSWYGGLRIGLFAAFVSSLAISFFFLQPVFSLYISDWDSKVRLILFVLVATLISWLNSELHFAKQRLEQTNQQLQSSEARFRRLAESNIMGVMVADMNGAIAEANDAFLNMVGYTREDLLAGQVRWREMTPPEYAHLDEKAVDELLTHGVATPFEKEYIRKDGSCVPVIVGIVMLQEPFHRQQEVVAFCIELSRQKQIEATLQRRESELELITNAVPVLIAYVDAQQRYRFNNKGYEEMYGLSASATYGKHIQEILGISVYQSILPYVELVLSGESITFEAQVFDKNGIVHDVKTNYVPQFDMRGEVEGFVALVTDITNHKLAEKALKESEARLRTLTEKVRVIPWEVDANSGNFTYVGPQSLEILGYPQTDWYTENFWYEHIHPEDREWAIQYCYESSLSLNNYEFEYRMLTADGRVLWMYDIVNVVRTGETPKLLHGFMIDISDRKQVEQEREQLLAREQAARSTAEAANRMKDEFLATLSHELRTPLNAMLGWTQLLKSRTFDENTTALALDTIYRNTKSLKQLIEDILDVSQIITGKLGLNAQPVELIPIVEATIDTLKAAAEAKEITLECQFDPQVGVVIADANRLQQIVWNLVSNAVKFSSIGGKITIQLQRLDGCVQIRVSDTGIGIPSEFLPYVFERFRQADGSLTRSHGGLGLGLAIVRHLVELHGGTVSAESPGKGQGATFIVNLPMKAVAVQVNDRSLGNREQVTGNR